MLVEPGIYEHNIPGYGTAGQQLREQYAYLGENYRSRFRLKPMLTGRSSGHKAIMLDPVQQSGIGISHYTGTNRV